MHLIYHCNKDHQNSDSPQKPSRKMQSVSLTSIPKPNHSNSTKFNGNSNPSDNINFYCQKTSAENNINCHLLMHGMPATPIYIAHSGRQRPQTGVIWCAAQPGLVYPANSASQKLVNRWRTTTSSPPHTLRIDGSVPTQNRMWGHTLPFHSKFVFPRQPLALYSKLVHSFIHHHRRSAAIFKRKNGETQIY